MAPSITPSHRDAPVVSMLELVVTSSDTGDNCKSRGWTARVYVWSV